MRRVAEEGMRVKNEAVLYNCMAALRAWHLAWRWFVYVYDCLGWEGALVKTRG